LNIVNIFREFIRKKVDFHCSDSSFSLDIGCGFSSHGSTNFIKYQVLNIGTVSCDIGHPEIKIPNFVQCDGQKLPFKAATFDCIFMLQVIEHVPRLQDLMKEIKRVLKPEGTLMLTTPNFYSADSFRDPNHIWHFTPENLELLLSNFFNSVSITGNSGPWALYNMTPVASFPALRSFSHNILRTLSVSFIRFPLFSNTLGGLAKIPRTDSELQRGYLP
jgi:ubiquinone/menaquinone biosynthesis C-methylase UbiE